MNCSSNSSQKKINNLVNKCPCHYTFCVHNIMSITIQGIRFPTQKSTRQHKKLMSKLPNSDTWIHYGDNRYESWHKAPGAKFLPASQLHSDPERRRSFIARHASNANKKFSPAWFATHALW